MVNKNINSPTSQQWLNPWTAHWKLIHGSCSCSFLLLSEFGSICEEITARFAFTHELQLHFLRKIEWRIRVDARYIHHSRSLLQAPTPTAAARCQAAWRKGVWGKTSSAMKRTPPSNDDSVCTLCAILRFGSLSALFANATWIE